MFPDLSGTLTTMIALAPMHIRRLSRDSFCPTCWNSSFSSSSVIYNLYSCSSTTLSKDTSIQNRFILSLEEWFLKIVNGVTLGKIETLFTAIVRFITASKVAGIISMVLLFALFITSVKIIMPLVGQELMPPTRIQGL